MQSPRNKIVMIRVSWNGYLTTKQDDKSQILEEILMKLLTEDKKWLKLGAAAFLSVGLLAACGDGEDDTDVDVDTPPADGEVDDGTDTDVDLDMEDGTDSETDTETDTGTDTETDTDSETDDSK